MGRNPEKCNFESSASANSATSATKSLPVSAMVNYDKIKSNGNVICADLSLKLENAQAP
jgi:hypothetical protein